MISNSQIFKGEYSLNNVSGVMISVLCTSSDDPLYLYIVS